MSRPEPLTVYLPFVVEYVADPVRAGAPTSAATQGAGRACAPAMDTTDTSSAAAISAREANAFCLFITYSSTAAVQSKGNTRFAPARPDGRRQRFHWEIRRRSLCTRHCQLDRRTGAAGTALPRYG